MELGAGRSRSDLPTDVLLYGSEKEYAHMPFIMETPSPIHQDFNHLASLVLHAVA